MQKHTVGTTWQKICVLYRCLAWIKQINISIKFMHAKKSKVSLGKSMKNLFFIQDRKSNLIKNNNLKILVSYVLHKWILLQERCKPWWAGSQGWSKNRTSILENFLWIGLGIFWTLNHFYRIFLSSPHKWFPECNVLYSICLFFSIITYLGK